MRNWFRDWLGITDLEYDLRQERDFSSELSVVVGRLRKDLRALEFEHKKLLLKVDPESVSPFDPDRKAASDKLAEEQIKRLKAEDWARKHTTGEA